MFALTSQMQRVLVFVRSNIAEGSSRNSDGILLFQDANDVSTDFDSVPLYDARVSEAEKRI